MIYFLISFLVLLVSTTSYYCGYQMGKDVMEAHDRETFRDQQYHIGTLQEIINDMMEKRHNDN